MKTRKRLLALVATVGIVCSIFAYTSSAPASASGGGGGQSITHIGYNQIDGVDTEIAIVRTACKINVREWTDYAKKVFAKVKERTDALTEGWDYYSPSPTWDQILIGYVQYSWRCPDVSGNPAVVAHAKDVVIPTPTIIGGVDQTFTLAYFQSKDVKHQLAIIKTACQLDIPAWTAYAVKVYNAQKEVLDRQTISWGVNAATPAFVDAWNNWYSLVYGCRPIRPALPDSQFALAA